MRIIQNYQSNTIQITELLKLHHAVVGLYVYMCGSCYPIVYNNVNNHLSTNEADTALARPGNGTIALFSVMKGFDLPKQNQEI